MKQLLIIVILCGLSFRGHSDTAVAPAPDTTPPEPFHCMMPMYVMPGFPGGEDSMFHFLTANIKYPDLCSDECISGRVVAGFTIDSCGEIRDIRIIKSLNRSFDDEVLRVIHLFPRFTPGSEAGIACDVKYLLPVHFSMPE